MKKERLIFISLLVLVFFAFSCGGSKTTEKESETTDNESVTNTNNETANANSDEGLFSDAEGNFKIRFPVAPTRSSQPITTDVGEITMVSFMYEQGDEAAYMLAYSDYPKTAIEGSNTQELLKNAMNGFVNSLQVNIEKEELISLGKSKGIYFTGKNATGDLYVIMKDYLVGNRLYQIGILQSNRYPTEKEVNDFINSFKLIKE